MVEIRKLEPSVRIRLPPSNKIKPWSKANTRRQMTKRRLADYPPPTPQPTPCRLWQGAADKQGYGARKVNGKTVKVHRWLVEQVEGRKLSPRQVVLHLCDNPPCYRYDHLRVGTIQENNEDRHRKGRTKQKAQHMHGETNGRAKLTRKQATLAKIDYSAGVSPEEIAKRYGVHRTTIYRLVSGQTWAKQRKQLEEHVHTDVVDEGG